MRRISAITKVSIGLVALTLSLVTTAQFLRLVPDRFQLLAEGRSRLCETLALGFAADAQLGTFFPAASAARAVVARDPDLLSVGLRTEAGEVLFQTEEHARLWSHERVGDATLSHIEVPIFRNEEQWATAELCFRPLVPASPVWFVHSPVVQLLAFLAVGGFVVYRWYLKKILTYLDPSKVIPERVKNAFDTLAEGVLILDERKQIVLANESFCRAVGRTYQSLQGRAASQLPWLNGDGSAAVMDLPWTRAASTGRSPTGILLRLKGDQADISYSVNASPILASGGQPRGVLATFDDVSEIERQKLALEEMVRKLDESREKIRAERRADAAGHARPAHRMPQSACVLRSSRAGVEAGQA